MKIPRKLKKAFKVKFIALYPVGLWPSKEIRIDKIEQNYRHWRRPGVITIGGKSLIAWRLV
jgi:hypothetical protein